jgi:hypothetical protein
MRQARIGLTRLAEVLCSDLAGVTAVARLMDDPSFAPPLEREPGFAEGSEAAPRRPAGDHLRQPSSIGLHDDDAGRTDHIKRRPADFQFEVMLREDLMVRPQVLLGLAEAEV